MPQLDDYEDVNPEIEIVELDFAEFETDPTLDSEFVSEFEDNEAEAEIDRLVLNETASH